MRNFKRLSANDMKLDKTFEWMDEQRSEWTSGWLNGWVGMENEYDNIENQIKSKKNSLDPEVKTFRNFQQLYLTKTTTEKSQINYSPQ